MYLRKYGQDALRLRRGEEKTGKQVLCSIIKYWYRILLTDDHALLNAVTIGQVENPQCDSWARNTGDDMYKIGPGSIWFYRDGRDLGGNNKTK